MSQTKPLKILKASAGSGKTFALTVHFIGLLLDRPESYREILALTFTNKATAEMKIRILGTLEMLAQQDLKLPDTAELASYHQAILKSRPHWRRDDIQQRADQAYRYILHDYSRFSVMTIDRFSQRVIRSFTYELGLDSSFHIELNTTKVLQDLMNRLYDQLGEHQELLNWVMERIRAQIDSDKSWKIDRELMKLANNIFKDDFKPLEEAALRPGNEDLFDRIAKHTKEKIDGFTQQSIQFTNQIADVIIQSSVKEADLYNRSKNYLTKFEDNRKGWGNYYALLSNLQNLKGNIDAYQTEAKRTAAVEELFRQVDPIMHEFCHYIHENLKAYNLALAINSNIHYLRLLIDMTKMLADWRVENGAQLVSDAQLLLSKIGRTEEGDPTFIWEKIGNRYRNFLLDEFQDTSHAQWNNLLPLIINALATSPADRAAHLIVGDVKQSIYRWRHGDFRILLEGVEKNVKDAFHLSDSSALILHDMLDTNYRSEENIIEFNNYLYRLLPGKFQAHINAAAAEALQDSYQAAWVDRGLEDVINRAYEGAAQLVPPHKKGTGKGTIQVEFIGKDPGEKGVLTLPVFRQKACEKVYLQIVAWLENKTYQPGDIGILVRANSDAVVILEYIKWRQSQGGPQFPIIAGDGLKVGGHDAIKCIVALLRFMAHEGREFNSYLADGIFHYYAQKGQSVPEEVWMLCSQGAIENLQGYFPEALLTNWAELNLLPLATLVERLISCFEFDQDKTAVPHLLQLRDMVAHYVHTEIPSLHRFLEYWDEEGFEKALNGHQERRSVEILTIHKAKGLEYDVVMLPFCTWAMTGSHKNQVWFSLEDTYAADLLSAPLPFTKAITETSLIDQYFEEELYNYMDALNILYVATTRAKKHLYLLANNPHSKRISNVGDMLHDILLDHPASTHGPDDLQPLQVWVKGKEKERSLSEAEDELLTASDTNSEEDDRVIYLHGYPSTDALKNVLIVHAHEHTPRTAQQKVSVLFSNALHEVMATIQSEEEAESLIDHLVMEGRIGSKERDQAVKWVHQAWNHPDLQPYFQGDYKQSNEQSIIDATGKSVRPDKVFLGLDETLVVDFKLSAETGLDEHMDQLRTYAQHLQEMGLPSVKAYLYYFIQNKTIAV